MPPTWEEHGNIKFCLLQSGVSNERTMSHLHMISWGFLGFLPKTILGPPYAYMFGEFWIFVHNEIDSGSSQLSASKIMPFGSMCDHICKSQFTDGCSFSYYILQFHWYGRDCRKVAACLFSYHNQIQSLCMHYKCHISPFILLTAFRYFLFEYQVQSKSI